MSVRGARGGWRLLRLRGERRCGEDEKRTDETARAHGAAPFDAGPAEPLKSTTRRRARLRIVAERGRRGDLRDVARLQPRGGERAGGQERGRRRHDPRVRGRRPIEEIGEQAAEAEK